eukprot:1928746-Pyramimonas_sp.AAC.1
MQDLKKNPSVISGAASTTAPSHGGGPPGLSGPSSFSPSYVELTDTPDPSRQVAALRAPVRPE